MGHFPDEGEIQIGHNGANNLGPRNHNGKVSLMLQLIKSLIFYASFQSAHDFRAGNSRGRYLAMGYALSTVRFLISLVSFNRRANDLPLDSQASHYLVLLPIGEATPPHDPRGATVQVNLIWIFIFLLIFWTLVLAFILLLLFSFLST